MSRSRAALLALFTCSFLLYLTPALRFDFDGLYGQDAYAYLNYARGPLTDRLFDPGRLPPFFWPPGYPLLVALLALWLGPIRAAPLVSLVAGALVPPLTVLLGHALWPARRRIGWIAGGIAALVPQLWQSSAVAMADTTALAAATLGAIALARYARVGGGRRLALGAGALAFAMLTRVAYVVVALPLTGLAFAAMPREGRARATHDLLVAGAVALVVLSPLLSGLSDGAGSPVAANLESHGWSPATIVRATHETAQGTFRYRLPNGIWYAVAPARHFYLTPVVALFLVPGLLQILSRWHLEQWLVTLGWPAAQWLLLSGFEFQIARYALAALPPLALLAAGGIDLALRGSARRGRMLVAGVLAVGVLWMLVSGLALTGSLVARKADSLATVRWVETRIEPEARLLTFGLTLTAQTYTAIDVTDIFSLSSREIDALHAEARPLYLLLDVDNIEAQWRGRSPERNYRHLREGPGLAPIGKYGVYTLFRVGGG